MDKFYHGYEGEKAIQFRTEERKLVIWEGFFDDIMEQFEKLNLSQCRFSESREVRREICNIFQDAIKKDNSVWIAEE